jgi:hypothetical protein
MDEKMTMKLNQFRYETESWKRLLEFIRQENSFAKNRLAEVIRLSKGEQSFLNRAERYLDDIIQIETVVALIRVDVAAFEKWFDKQPVLEADIQRMITKKYTIDKEVKKLEMEFKNIKSLFDNFMMEAVMVRESA